MVEPTDFDQARADLLLGMLRRHADRLIAGGTCSREEVATALLLVFVETAWPLEHGRPLASALARVAEGLGLGIVAMEARPADGRLQ